MLIYPDSPEARERAAHVTAAGGLVAFRTDTFYGVGADPFNPAALELINALKGRDGKPILVLAADAFDAERLLAERTRTFELLAARHWPGALTLVAAARAEVPELLTAGTGTVGVRLPDDAQARAIVRACGGLLTATSANPAGRPPARTAREVADYFPERTRPRHRRRRDADGAALDGRRRDERRPAPHPRRRRHARRTGRDFARRRDRVLNYCPAL